MIFRQKIQKEEIFSLVKDKCIKLIKNPSFEMENEELIIKFIMNEREQIISVVPIDIGDI